MRKDSIIFLKRLLDLKKNNNDKDNFIVDCQCFNEIPNIETAAHDIIKDLIDNYCLTSKSSINDKGEIRIYLTVDGITYFDNPEVEKSNPSFDLKIFGGQVSIATGTAKTEAIQYNQSENIQDSQKYHVSKEKKRKVLISYSKTPSSNIEWIVKLAERLIDDGIEVTVGDNCMNNMIYDIYDKIIVLCDDNYKNKADKNMEDDKDTSAIITSQLYERIDSEKIIPIVHKKDENNQPFLPSYFSSGIYTDLTDMEKGYKELLNLILKNYGIGQDSKENVTSIKKCINRIEFMLKSSLNNSLNKFPDPIRRF